MARTAQEGNTRQDKTVRTHAPAGQKEARKTPTRQATGWLRIVFTLGVGCAVWHLRRSVTKQVSKWSQAARRRVAQLSSRTMWKAACSNARAGMRHPAAGRGCGTELYGNSPRERFEAVTAVTAEQRRAIVATLLDGCPEKGWPYGCNTALNPWLVFLGASPGSSPKRGDSNYGRRKGVPPTGEIPPAWIQYEDPKGFFKRLRMVATTLMQGDGLAPDEAAGLVGMMNMDTEAQGDVRNVMIRPAFARWSLDVIFNRLRPKYVIALGLKGFLTSREHAWIRQEIGTHLGKAFNPRKPDWSLPFRGYATGNLKFAIWRREGAGPAQYFIMYPQHPSKIPMNNWDTWCKAAREFAVCAQRLP